MTDSGPLLVLRESVGERDGRFVVLRFTVLVARRSGAPARPSFFSRRLSGLVRRSFSFVFRRSSSLLVRDKSVV